MNAKQMPSEKSVFQIEVEVEDLLQQMTLEEKLSLLGGVRRFHVPGIPRLGLPELNLADGPVGIRDHTPSTAYPATTCLAATWNIELAKEFGVSMGRDARKRNYHVILGPGLNIIRLPSNGRNFEYLTEDPILGKSLSAPIIKGIQSRGVAAAPKHFAANNQETNRMSHNVVVSERALREIYLPAFRGAVQDGKTWMIMTAYNQLNQSWCTENQWLNIKLLKGDWQFQGVVVSDWGASHSTLGSAFGGLDLEMPGPRVFWHEKLKELLESGELPMDLVDDKVRRQLRMRIALGLQMDRTEYVEQDPDKLSAKVALQIAREGFVLLKNENKLLPLNPTELQHLVLLGPNADHIPQAGGSGLVEACRSVTVADGLRSLLPENVAVSLVGNAPTGTLDELLPHTMYNGGLQLTYRRAPFSRRVDHSTSVAGININWSETGIPEGIDPERFYAEWSGFITPEKTGLHLFSLAVVGRSASVSVDGEIVVATGDADHLQTVQGGIVLEAGKTYNLTADYRRGRAEEAIMRVAWGPGAIELTEIECRQVEDADAVILCIGFDSPTEGEGIDRSYALPTLQTNLIRQAAALNENIIVLLNAGASVETADWIDHADALLHQWFPGQEGGQAAAEIILGKYSPSGKLPITWEKQWEDIGAVASYPGTEEEVIYEEDILVGYRWFDQKKIEPLFPFGFGLSYAEFEYTDLKLQSFENEGIIELTFTLQNKGVMAADEIAQVYVSPPESEVLRPPRELKGFSRISLAPEQSKKVRITLKKEDLAWFNENTNTWIIDSGIYQILVGASSRDFQLTGFIELTGNSG